MLKRLKNVFVQVCVPDELDMAEHYRTPAEKTADLIVHVVGLTLAAVGGIIAIGSQSKFIERFTRNVVITIQIYF